MLIHLDSVSVQLGNKQLFSELKLSVESRSRLGIIGPNGAGKSSLLKVLAGSLEPDHGRVVHSSGVVIGYVQQIDNFDPAWSVQQAVINTADLNAENSDHTVRASKALSRSGFSDFTESVGDLSGGWRKRLGLASALALEPDVLLLDEPTNHLDLAGLNWLERMLTTADFAWVLVSHDRYFLDRTVQEVMEIAPYYVTGSFLVEGRYFDFKERRQDYLEQEAKRTSALANRVRRELEWASRSPKARTGKAAYRMKEAKRLSSELKELRQRHRSQEVNVSFSSSGRKTKQLVKIQGASYQFPERAIFSDLTFTVFNGMCLGVLGKNGQGKSTLMKVIGGELKPQTGKVKHTTGLQVVYFDQLRATLEESSTLAELLGEGQDHVIYKGSSRHIVSWAKQFEFEPSDLEKSVSKLSGGERARALLSRLVRQEADLLLLDEPTNDLDIPMLEVLEKMILEFDGAVVLVSHDRFLLDEVCTHFLGFSDDGGLLLFASYQQWADVALKSDGEKPKVAQKESTTKQEKRAGKKLSYKDKLEYGRIEKMIMQAEEVLERLESKAADPEIHRDLEASKQISEELAQAKQEVERLYERWEELEALRSEEV